jgi:hypothetical protein
MREVEKPGRGAGLLLFQSQGHPLIALVNNCSAANALAVSYWPGQPVLTSMRRGLASSAFGSVSVITPSRISALILS